MKWTDGAERSVCTLLYSGIGGFAVEKAARQAGSNVRTPLRDRPVSYIAARFDLKNPADCQKQGL